MMEDRFTFRVWDSRNNCWLHGYTKESGGCSLVGEYILLGSWLSGVRLEDINKLIFEQCTGRKDKDGNLAFEGDIVILAFIPKGAEAWSYIVRYGNGTWDSGVYEYVGFYGECTQRGETDGHGNVIYDCEIIGNIHENPELLEVKHED